MDVVWLSPIYESPQADMGYDISDYQAIDPRYGTMSDWEDIRDACHERGMKLVMDLVVNHSSDQVRYYIMSLLKPSTHGSRSLDPLGTIRKETGTSGVTPKSMTRAKEGLQTTGRDALERQHLPD